MTIRFSGPLPVPALNLRPLGRVHTHVPANDNGRTGPSDALLDAALRHFAEHGLAAAQNARRQAEAAFFAGNREGYQWWLEICRALDRAMARELDVQASRRK